MIEDAKKKYRYRDRAMRILSKSGTMRAVILRNSQLVALAAEKHSLDPVSSVFLAKSMSAASLLSSFLKGEERISLQFEGSGVLSLIFAEAMQVGEVRGYVRKRSGVDDPLQDIAAMHDVLGAGFLKVAKYRYNHYEPTTGIVELYRGDISSDLANYLLQSEQIPSGVRLDVTADDYGAILESGGAIVQAMPGASDEEIAAAERALANLPNIGDLLGKGMQLEDIVQQAFPFDFDVIGTTPLDFYCRCSLDKFKSAIQSLGIEEIKDMKEKNHHELVCQYCSTKYLLQESDFDELTANLLASNN